jgi:probable O-glycosylation ligase (exosortase A-associated)
MKGLLFTYALTYGGALLSLFNPFYGLLVYVSFAIIRPEYMWSWSVPEGNYSRVVAVGLLAGWAFRGFGRWRFGRARGVVAALVCFWLWSVVAVAFAQDREIAWNYVESLAKILLPFLVGITVIDSVRKVKQLAWVILLSEGYVAWEFNLSYFEGYNRLWRENFGGMDNNCHAIALVACTGLAVFVGLHERRWWLKGLAFGAALLMIHAILFSFSRGGMLSLVVTALAGFLLVPKKWQHYVGFAAVVVVGLRLAGPEVTARFLTTFAGEGARDASAQSRLDLWAGCWDSMLRRPWGVGPDHWGLIAPEYGFARGKNAHSLWLEVGASLGFPGLLLLLRFYGLGLVRLCPLTRECRPVADPEYRGLARMVIASLIGFAVAAQFVSLDRLEPPYYIALLGAALLKLDSQRAAREEPAGTCTLPAAWDMYPPRALRFRVYPGLYPGACVPNGNGSRT